MTQLFLVRHGATDANQRVPYLLQGCGADLSLNEYGRQQAKRAAAFLASFPVRQIYTSPLKRATETAEIIAQPAGLNVRHVPEITECDVGRWEGKDWDTIAREDPDAYHRFHSDPATHPYLGGESYSDVLRRALPVFSRLLAQHVGETIVVVAHNIVNRAYIAHLLGLELRRAKELRQDNCCVNVIRLTDGNPALVTMNALFHLENT